MCILPATTASRNFATEPAVPVYDLYAVDAVRDLDERSRASSGHVHRAIHEFAVFVEQEFVRTARKPDRNGLKHCRAATRHDEVLR